MSHRGLRIWQCGMEEEDQSMTTYRRSTNAGPEEPWHFSRACVDDPKADYHVRYDKPLYSELCYRCKSERVVHMPRLVIDQVVLPHGRSGLRLAA
jgi:hypothetical protein